MMLHIVLYEPEIPPNTGNIIRLCANVGATLHLIKPLGFDIDDKSLRRAGLDYWQWMDMQVHDNFSAFCDSNASLRILCCETSGKHCYSDIQFRCNDAILFGSETRGLPAALLASVPAEDTFYLPMKQDIRSLNLSNAVAVALYEAWRQLDFACSS